MESHLEELALDAAEVRAKCRLELPVPVLIPIVLGGQHAPLSYTPPRWAGPPTTYGPDQPPPPSKRPAAEDAGGIAAAKKWRKARVDEAG